MSLGFPDNSQSRAVRLESEVASHHSRKWRNAATAMAVLRFLLRGQLLKAFSDCRQIKQRIVAKAVGAARCDHRLP